MTFYDDLKVDVEGLITEFGTSAILREVTSKGSYNPTTGEMDGRTVSDQDCEVVRDSGTYLRLGGTIIESSRTRYLLSSKGISNPPVVGFKLVIGEDEWDISEVDPIEPGPTNLGWLVSIG